MLNMNSPTVQNLMQSGFNPYMNSGYIPQQQPIQPMYNPYMVQPQQPIQTDNIDWGYCYDPMPNIIVNEARGINSQIMQPNNNYYGNYSNAYNPSMFNGYMNPILMQNQIESNRIKQREEAITQGKIWRRLFENEAKYNDDIDIDEMVHHVESLYYHEPIKQDLPIKEKIIVDKNNHIAEVEARYNYYTQNNIPIIDNRYIMLSNICKYYNNINSVIGDSENCDMVDYFRRVYPELKHQQLEYEAERHSRNLKNRYNSDEFNKMIDKYSSNKSDSYYSKLLENFSDTGVKLETSNGLVVTADEMEVKLPDRLLRKQQEYQEQRKRFYDAIFNKEG